MSHFNPNQANIAGEGAAPVDGNRPKRQHIILGILLGLSALFASGCSIVAGSGTPEVCSPACRPGAACVSGRCIEAMEAEETLSCVEGSTISMCPEGNRCVFGRCEPDLRCLDEDCPDGFTCSADGYCRETVRCSDDTACDDTLFCSGVERCNLDTGECEVGTPPCTAENPVCSEQDGACLECSGDIDCANDNFCDGREICASGFCATSTTPDCPHGCDIDSNRCKECSVTSDCTTTPCIDGEFNCTESGTCELVTPGCAKPEFCDATGGPDGGIACFDCGIDADCDSGLRCDGIDRCVEGECVIQTSSSDPCDDNDDAPNCVEAPNDEDGYTCAACVVDADCNDSQFCNGTEVCVEALGRCEFQFDDDETPNSALICTEPGLSACAEDDDTCNFCVDEDDCRDGDACTEDTCIGRERCEHEEKCPGRECIEELDGLCGNCSSHNQCDDGQFCNGQEECRVEYVLVIIPVSTDCYDGNDPCRGNTPFCDEVNNRCNQCEVQAHCLDNNECNGIESCSNGSCQAGVPVNCGPGATCQPSTGACVADPPPPEPTPPPPEPTPPPEPDQGPD